MKRAICLLIGLVLLLPCVPAKAEIGVAGLIEIGGVGLFITGLVLGITENGKAKDLHTEYLAQETADSAVAKFNEHSDAVSKANTWMAVGYGGLGLTITTLILDKTYFSRYNVGSLDTEFRNGTTQLAYTVRF